jgi:UDP-N-acetylmuramate dehydrogenase
LNKNKKVYTEFLSRIESTITKKHLYIDEPMSKHTTFKIGGPADILITPSSVEEIAFVIQNAKLCNINVTILGNGSNVLVLDRGIRGMVLKIGTEISYIKHHGNKITAGAGALLSDVSKYAAAQNLAGMEFAVGIPGSLGGAVFMNAGAYDGEMSHIVTGAVSVCPDGEIKRMNYEDINFNYRHSVFQDNKCVVCEVELTLKEGEHKLIHHRMRDLTARRETKQPLEMPSAGSTFKRPPGYFAGTLIEQTGLKGLKIGGAQVSDKHAGFVVNAGNATAQDVLALIKEVQRRVYEKFGVSLQPEVRILGED